MAMRLQATAVALVSSPPAFRQTCASRAAAVEVRRSLAERWPEYQGCKNWEGLLEPLDENLRSEILRYGKFVQCAYDAFDFDVSSLTFGTCRYPESQLLSVSGLGDSGYVSTRSLHATSGIALPSWVDRAPSWMTKQSSWIGYVAVSDDEETISRLGRRDVVIAYRGTVTCLEWLENMRSMLTQLPEGLPAAGPMVESGFWSLFTSGGAGSLQKAVREEVGRLLADYAGETISITVTGHSLGAALAVLTAYDISVAFRHLAPPVTAYSFAGPRVGNDSFRRHLERHGGKVLRIVNSQDVITKVPGIVLEKDDDDVEAPESSRRKTHLPRELLRGLLDDRWDYADVGQELRLSTHDCPYLSRHSGNVAKCHELDTYLQLVSGRLSSSCSLAGKSSQQ